VRMLGSGTAVNIDWEKLNNVRPDSKKPPSEGNSYLLTGVREAYFSLVKHKCCYFFKMQLISQ